MGNTFVVPKASVTKPKSVSFVRLKLLRKLSSVTQPLTTLGPAFLVPRNGDSKQVLAILLVAPL